MSYLKFKDCRTWLIAGLVALFSLFALWVRLLPMFALGQSDILASVGSDDPLYNLRQVEQILANFPNYAWFDPMTLFPTGSKIYWGPLFTVIAAFACLVTGATTRPEIIGVSLVVPPLMAAAMVPLMYFVGKTCGDWKTGLLAAGFTAVVSGQYFSRSLFGYFDHHIGEVLFSTLFCLIYMYAVFSEKRTAIDLKTFSTQKRTFMIAAFAGIAYLLGLFAMPTMILFAMIVGIFTVIQFVIDFFRNRTSEYLLVINTVIFTIAIAGLLAFGFKGSSLNLSDYTVGHVLAYLALIGGTWALYGIAQYLKGKERYYYPAALAGLALAVSLLLFIASPKVFNLLIVSLFSFFGQAAITNTVQEARGWSPGAAWIVFNYGLILFAGGAVVMLYNNIRDEHPHQIYALVWSIVILFSTWQHVRYEYYLAVNIALLSAVCVSFVFENTRNNVKKIIPGFGSIREKTGVKDITDEESSHGKKRKRTIRKESVSFSTDYILSGLLVVTVGLAILFAYTSATYNYSSAVSSPFRMNGDWKESLEWMANNTPETGVNYLTIYDPVTFRYPPQAYGVMSWWDYGHMITYIAKRIPNANPFQQGVAGPDGSAAFFISTSEDLANTVLDHDGTRYIITDIEMDTGKFYAMTTWYNATASIGPYQTILLTTLRDDPNALQPVTLYTQQYYLTMVSRLHNFDGSMVQPSNVYYIEYADPDITQLSLPAITNGGEMNASEAMKRVVQFNAGASLGHHAVILSPAITAPTETVPALRHYRLVHESPSNVFSTATPDVKYVKVFEYVRGARITGDGIIEVPLVTNTGRSFMYRQESVNGEFVVPYSTTGTSGVKATGKYRIAGTSREFEVPESAIENGMVIN